MTMPTPEQAAKRVSRIVEASRAMLADPSNMDVRRDYLRATFNHDWTAASIVALADGTTVVPQEPGSARQLRDEPPPVAGTEGETTSQSQPYGDGASIAPSSPQPQHSDGEGE